MMRLMFLAGGLAAAQVGVAEPLFEDKSANLVDHEYTGDWVHFVGGGVAIFDCNGDTFPDVFAAGGSSPARLMINQGQFEFSDGGSFSTAVIGAYPLDIDGDGEVDLAVLRDGANQLLQGAGDCTFEDASADWGFDGGDAWTTAFTATWEGDRPTLVFGNYVDRADPDGPFGACAAHDLHRPSPEGYVKTKIQPGFCTLSMLASDWQRSGTPMLRISNDRHYHQDEGFEQMFDLASLSQRDGWPEQKLWGMGIASADVTGDGKPEVMLSSMGDQLLQINEGEGFRDAPYGQGTFATRPHAGGDTRPSTGWHTEFADIDNDGLLDIFIAKGNVDAMPEAAAFDPNNLLIQRPDGTFREAAATAGVASGERSRGAGLADFDGDGRLDLVVVNRSAGMELYRNVTADVGNWLSVELAQEGGNTRAVGAWIEVQANGKTQAREVTVGGGHASGQALPMHFGLGDAKEAKARVIWPDGEASDWQEIAINAAATVTR